MSQISAFRLWTLLGLLFAIGLSNCTDPLQVGSNLLEEDRASVGFTDTLSLKARTIPGDSVIAYAPNGLLTTFLFGRTEDEFFGTTETAIYFETFLPRDVGRKSQSRTFNDVSTNISR